MSEAIRLLTGLSNRGIPYRCTPEPGRWAWKATCPLCHRDRLRLNELDNGRVTIWCSKECPPEQIRHALLCPDRCFDCGTVFGEVERLRAELEETLWEFSEYRVRNPERVVLRAA